MITSATRAKYIATIGIECHVQLKTTSKLFASVGNDAREAPPNTLVSHICFGLPGALPVLNKEAIHLASRAAFALDSLPQKFSKFDRKHYFYPDLPLGYQITQFDEPIIIGGKVSIDVNGQSKIIGITRAHLEADAGKSTHPAGADYSLVDLNRAGTPLLEIVSEPDMHSSAEAKAYAHELYLRMRYADVSEANLYYGNMRFDVNVSVSQTKELGTRSETKNLNSFRSVEKAVDYEITRQIEKVEKGERIIQETRGWDDAKQKTISQRTKENADDYRYMPDPDLPPVVLTDNYISKIKAEMPLLPDDIRKIFTDIGLDITQIETLLDNPEITKILLKVSERAPDDISKIVANWLTGELLRIISQDEYDFINQYKLDAQDWIIVAGMVKNNETSSTGAKKLLGLLLKDASLTDENEQNKASRILETAKQYDVLQQSDEDEIAKIVVQVLTENPKATEDVKNGETKAIGFLVGQVMKASKGKANPGLAQQLIKKQLSL